MKLTIYGILLAIGGAVAGWFGDTVPTAIYLVGSAICLGFDCVCDTIKESKA